MKVSKITKEKLPSFCVSNGKIKIIFRHILDIMDQFHFDFLLKIRNTWTKKYPKLHVDSSLFRGENKIREVVSQKWAFIA